MMKRVVQPPVLQIFCDNNIMEFDTDDPSSPSHPSKNKSHPGEKARTEKLFFLVEMDPTSVVDGTLTSAGWVAEPVTTAGKMRETCPHCKGAPLQLVLRDKNVIRSHLYCDKCTRCYEARYPDGRSALTFPGASIF